MKATTIEDALVLWVAYRSRINDVTASVMMLYVDSFLKIVELKHQDKKELKKIIIESEFKLK